jgi:hypothetical protein
MPGTLRAFPFRFYFVSGSIRERGPPFTSDPLVSSENRRGATFPFDESRKFRTLRAIG